MTRLTSPEAKSGGRVTQGLMLGTSDIQNINVNFGTLDVQKLIILTL